jgi:squalene-associated FAD-dependent desaturase
MAMIHVIGAGMSGLACAVRCAMAGHQVALYEAAPRAGGRCRSYMDEGLGCVIDNGSHMLLGANRNTKDYLVRLGSQESVTEIRPASFAFRDIRTGAQWSLRPGSPWFPLWLLNPRRRVPGTSPADYVRALRLRRASASATVADFVGEDGPMMESFWQPLCRAVLNTDATEASARLLWKALSLSFFKGESACRPMIFSQGISAALVDPAIRLLESKGAIVRFQSRLRGLRWEDKDVLALRFPEGLLRVANDDAVVLAVPPDICAELWPDANPPQEARPIVNVHFKLGTQIDLPGGLPFLGLIGSDAQWLFARGNILSVTMSAATAYVDRPNFELANHLWDEITRILGRNMGRLPPWRVIKERRATIAQTPEIIAQRPGARTMLGNLFLAGDWTNTGLPATIEGSIASGYTAARHAMGAIASRKRD